MKGRRLFTAIAGAVVASSVAGIAYATIPDQQNVYSACMLKGVGTIRLIDKSLPTTNLMSRCTDKEIEISWNQAGQQGPAGPQGPKGETGATGAAGKDGTNGKDGVSIATAAEPAGVNCAEGGTRLTAANGASYVCNGKPGTEGAPGPKGDKGDPCLPSDPACVGPKGDTGDTGPAGPAGGMAAYQKTEIGAVFVPAQDLDYHTLITLTLPPGYYVVTVSALVFLTSPCRLAASPGGEWVTNGPLNFTTTYSNTSASDQDIHLQCKSEEGVPGVTLMHGNLTAIKVASITNT